MPCACNTTFDQWIEIGYRQGWCGPPVCYTHDGLPVTAQEDEQLFDIGSDPCIHVLRLYADLPTKKAVEANHSPSIWRARNIGL